MLDFSSKAFFMLAVFLKRIVKRILHVGSEFVVYNGIVIWTYGFGFSCTPEILVC